MTAAEIAERLDYYGSWYDVNIDRDYAYVNFATLSKFFAETLAVAEHILLRPAFPEEELRTYCAKRKQRLAIDRTKVDVEAREAFARALFGPQHPYGTSYDEAEYDRLTRADVVEFHRRRYTAENCFVVCSGRIGERERQAVAALAERIPHGGATVPAAFPAPVTEHEAFVGHPGAVQLVAADRTAALSAPAPRFPGDAGRGHGAGRLLRLAADAEPARGARIHLRRGGRDGQFRTRRLLRRGHAGRNRRDARGPASDLRRDRTAAHGADARRGAGDREEHDGRAR